MLILENLPLRRLLGLYEPQQEGAIVYPGSLGVRGCWGPSVPPVPRCKGVLGT